MMHSRYSSASWSSSLLSSSLGCCFISVMESGSESGSGWKTETSILDISVSPLVGFCCSSLSFLESAFWSRLLFSACDAPSSASCTSFSRSLTWSSSSLLIAHSSSGPSSASSSSTDLSLSPFCNSGSFKGVPDFLCTDADWTESFRP